MASSVPPEASTLLSNIVDVWEHRTALRLALTSESPAKIVLHHNKGRETGILRFLHSGKVYDRKSNMMIRYRCIACSRELVCSLNNVMRRMNRRVFDCRMCRHFTHGQDGPWTHSNEAFLKSVGESSALDVIRDRFLTPHEFDALRGSIESFQRGKFTDLTLFEYIPLVSSTLDTGSRHVSLRPYLYDRTRDVFEKIEDVCMVCQMCGDRFTTPSLKRFVGLECVTCLECSGGMPYRSKDKWLENCNGEPVSYRSRYEAKFIRFCNKYGMKVNDGPIVSYVWLGHRIEYRIPYVVRALGLLVDIKDNPTWARERDNEDKAAVRTSAISCIIAESPDMFREHTTCFPGNYVRETRRMLARLGLSMKRDREKNVLMNERLMQLAKERKASGLSRRAVVFSPTLTIR